MTGYWYWNPVCETQYGSARTESRKPCCSGWGSSASEPYGCAWPNAWAGGPELLAVAAQQYLPVVDEVHEPQERRHVAGLLRRAAGQAQLLSNYLMVERLLTAAVTLTDRADTAALIELHTGRHQALYSLGRLDDADEIYETIDRLCTEPAERADAVLVRISSLTNRNRPQEAVSLGLEQLR